MRLYFKGHKGSIYQVSCILLPYTKHIGDISSMIWLFVLDEISEINMNGDNNHFKHDVKLIHETSQSGDKFSH